jgi:hypothetical protein
MGLPWPTFPLKSPWTSHWLGRFDCRSSSEPSGMLSTEDLFHRNHVPRRISVDFMVALGYSFVYSRFQFPNSVRTFVDTVLATGRRFVTALFVQRQCNCLGPFELI